MLLLRRLITSFGGRPNGCVEATSPFRCLLIRNTFVCGQFFIPEALEMATQQENPEKGLLMIGAVIGGIAFLVALATIFGAL